MERGRSDSHDMTFTLLGQACLSLVIGHALLRRLYHPDGSRSFQLAIEMGNCAGVITRRSYSKLTLKLREESLSSGQSSPWQGPFRQSQDGIRVCLIEC